MNTRVPIIKKLFENSKLFPNKIAFLTKSNRLSYGKLANSVFLYSDILEKKGIKKGDRVVIKASQSIEFVVAYFSIHFIGAVVVSLEKNTPDSKIADIKQLVSANYYIDNYLDDIEKVLKTKTVLENNKKELSFPSLDMPADILFTTGTTGSSKGVELTHLALVATAENLIYGCNYNQNTMIIVPGPLNHANAIRKIFTSVYNGSAVYILSGMTDMLGFFNALECNNSIACCLPPAAIRAIFTLTGDKIGHYASKIDFIESASAPLPETDKMHLCRLLPNTRLYNNYGSSESASVCMYDYSKHLELTNCIGKPTVNAQILIVDDDKNVINSSKENIGYIASKGDMNMLGYINEPLLTQSVLKNGIVFTNDLGYIENDFVYIIGRKGDVINVGGLKVSPTEVESAVLSFKGIDDCICIPVNDNITGKALKLIYVSPNKIDIKELNSFLATKLEQYKIPRFYEKTNKIARTYNGKLDRKYYST